MLGNLIWACHIPIWAGHISDMGLSHSDMGLSHSDMGWSLFRYGPVTFRYGPVTFRYKGTFCLKHFSTTIFHSMEQGQFSEAKSCSANQEIPRILWNPEVNYRVYRSPPLVLVQSSPLPNLFLENAF